MGGQDMLVTVHSPLPGAKDVLQMRPVALQSPTDPTFVLHDWSEAETLLEDMHLHRPGRMMWGLPDHFLHDTGVTQLQASAVLSTCVLASGGPDQMGVAFLGRDKEVAEVLNTLGFLQPAPHDRWHLAREGMRSLVPLRRLGQSEKVFCVRKNASDEEHTVFELIRRLEADGWEWRLWRPPSSRRKSEVIPRAFTPGAAKVWYSTLCPSRRYLLLLLRSEDSSPSLSSVSVEVWEVALTPRNFLSPQCLRLTQRFSLSLCLFTRSRSRSLSLSLSLSFFFLSLSLVIFSFYLSLSLSLPPPISFSLFVFFARFVCP